MDEHTRDRGKWPALLLGLLLAIAGVALAVGGGQLLMLGGSAYYLIAGVAVVVAGLLLALRKGAALWLYALILFATLVWALWEVGLDWWQLVPRVAIPCLIGIIMLLPWWRKPLNSRGGSLALTASIGAAIIVAIASQFSYPGTLRAASSLPITPRRSTRPRSRAPTGLPTVVPMLAPTTRHSTKSRPRTLANWKKCGAFKPAMNPAPMPRRKSPTRIRR